MAGERKPRTTHIYLAGAVAAFTVDMLIYPLDTLKTRYQSQSYAHAYATSSARNPQLFRGLYQGVGSVVVATLPAAGIFFSVYEGSKTMLSPGPLAHASASSLAELAACLALAPAEVVKQNAQMLRRRQQAGAGAGASRNATALSSSSLEAFRKVATGPGAARKLWTGYTALAARNLPFTALQFPLFEHIRGRALADDGTDRKLWELGVVTGASAGSAGAVAAFVTTPFDVFKTRMMLLAGGGAEGRARSIRATATDVWREKGFVGFFRGGLLRSVWTAVGSGLYLGTYEMAKIWLADRERV